LGVVGDKTPPTPMNRGEHPPPREELYPQIL